MRIIPSVVLALQCVQAFVPKAPLGTSFGSSFVKPDIHRSPPRAPALQQKAQRYPEDEDTPLRPTVRLGPKGGEELFDSIDAQPGFKPIQKRQPTPFTKLGRLIPEGVRSLALALGALSPLAGANFNPADAAPSGGRMGSGYRSAPSTRSFSTPRYSSPSRSYSSPGAPSYSSPYRSGPAVRSYNYYAPSPFISPFSPFGGFGGGYGMPYTPYASPGGSAVVTAAPGFGIGRLIPFIVLFFGLSTLANNILSRPSDSWEAADQGSSSLGSGVTVLKLQVGLDVPDRFSRDNIFGRLDEVVQKSTRSNTAETVSSAALALLRSSKYWMSAHGESRSFSKQDAQTESEFNRLALRERSKFERESDMLQRRDGIFGGRALSPSETRSTQAVVTLCLAIRGKNTKIERINSAQSLRTALELIAGNAMTDNGDNVLAFEVLWTPQDEQDVLTKRDIIDDYPELLNL